jgi:DNA polymerase I-like protein with 3'-5' exonuclease and polymerase domains
MLRQAARDFMVGDAKSNLWKLPAPFVGEYAERDALITLRLKRFLWKKLQTDGLESPYALEKSLLPVVFRMRKRGVRIDMGKAEQVRQQFLNEEKEIIAKIKRETNFQIDPWNSDGIATILKSRGHSLPITAKTGKPSISKEWLEKCQDTVAADILRIRRLNKSRTTFVESYVIEKAYKGRIHAEFHQLRSDDGGTVTGRFSCSNPNLQNLPARDVEIKKAVRGLFLPEEGEEWNAADYSSQEPRLTVHFAELVNLPGAKEAGDRYRANPRTDYHQMVADICNISRKRAKTINLGLAYGMGEASLCQNLGLPTEWIDRWDGSGKIEVAGPEGKAILAAYDEGAPFVRKLFKMCRERAEQRGYITKLFGGRCRFSRSAAERGAFPHKALNSLIQGSAAAQLKATMVAVSKAGFDSSILVCVHDEIGLSLLPSQRAAVIDIMENAVKLRVPTVVDLEVGPNWGDSRELTNDD